MQKLQFFQTSNFDPKQFCSLLTYEIVKSIESPEQGPNGFSFNESDTVQLWYFISTQNSSLSITLIQ